MASSACAEHLQHATERLARTRVVERIRGTERLFKGRSRSAAEPPETGSFRASGAAPPSTHSSSTAVARVARSGFREQLKGYRRGLGLQGRQRLGRQPEVRRPQSRDDHRRIERIIEAALRNGDGMRRILLVVGAAAWVASCTPKADGVDAGDLAFGEPVTVTKTWGSHNPAFDVDAGVDAGARRELEPTPPPRVTWADASRTRSWSR